MVTVGDVLVTNRIKEKYMEFIERRGIKHLSMKVSGMLSVIIQITPGALDYRNLSNIPTNIHGKDTTGSTCNRRFLIPSPILRVYVPHRILHPF